MEAFQTSQKFIKICQYTALREELLSSAQQYLSLISTCIYYSVALT